MLVAFEEDGEVCTIPYFKILKDQVLLDWFYTRPLSFSSFTYRENVCHGSILHAYSISSYYTRVPCTATTRVVHMCTAYYTRVHAQCDATRVVVQALCMCHACLLRVSRVSSACVTRVFCVCHACLLRVSRVSSACVTRVFCGVCHACLLRVARVSSVCGTRVTRVDCLSCG